MNKDRRARIEAVATRLEALKDTVSDLISEEQDYHDNMPESLQNGEKGEKAQEAIDALDEAQQALETAIEQLQTATG